MSESAESFWSKAVEFAFSQNLQKALEFIEKALALVPTSGKYAVEKAEILGELGKTKEAISFLAAGNFSPSNIIAEEVKKIEQIIAWDQIVPEDKSAQEKLTRLIKWGNDNGMDTKNIKVVYYSPDFRGVHANHRIRSGQRIVTASDNIFVILPKILESCALAKKVATCGVKLDYEFATALACMVYENKNNPKSWWHSYAESFPETADTFPYFFNAAEKEFLKGTIWEPSMKSEMKASFEEYNAICRKVPELKEMTHEVYLKLTTLACSRYFSVTEVPSQHLAVPIVDMFNYYTDKSGQTYWRYIPEEKAFAVIALKDIQWGEVIGLNYGTKPNGRYLLYYGFIPKDNDYMYISIELNMPESDPLLKKKQELLGYYKGERFLYASSFYFDWNENYNQNDRVLSLCRLAAYKDDIKKLKKELSKYSISERYMYFHLPVLSITNEMDALEILKEFAVSKTKEYPNTLENDQEILKTQKDLSENSKNALTVRIEELIAFKKTIEFADHMIKLLKRPTNAVQEIKIMTTWYREYANNIVLPLIQP